MTPAVYLSRLVDVSQMDIQSALDQMKSLLMLNGISGGGGAGTLGSGLQHALGSVLGGGLGSAAALGPQKVYKMAYYRKQTKNHWARDDPAFVAMQIALLLLAVFVYSIAFRSDSLLYTTLTFAFHSILVNYLFLGTLIATFHRAIANQYLNNNNNNNSGTPTSTQIQIHVRQSVEWMYAFDVHCNAFFPLFCILYIIQFFLLPLVLGKGFFAFFVSNTLYALGFSYYFYITHLGFRALPFLSNTEVFLLPVCIVVFIFLLNLVGYPFGFGWNASRIMAHLYFER